MAKRNRQRVSKGIFVLLLIGIGVFIFDRFAMDFIGSSELNDLTYQNEGYERAFKCEGKIYCSEMSSCEEAIFYLSNCPGIKMDGDRDGVPCESQWCR